MDRATTPPGWKRVTSALALLMLVVIAAADTPAAAAGAPVTLPDMQILVPTNAISVGIDPTSGDRQLRFTHVTTDIGAGPFELDPTYDSNTGTSTFVQVIYNSPSPGKWVRDHTVPVAVTGNWSPPSDYQFPLASFTLNQVNSDASLGPVVATSPKTDYCMTGDTRLTGVANTPNQTFISQGNCTDPTQRLGWSVGWGDEYDQTDSGQPIDLTGVPDGTYILRGVVDPLHVLTESDTTNDVTDTTLQISGDNVTVLSQTNGDPPTGGFGGSSSAGSGGSSSAGSGGSSSTGAGTPSSGGSGVRPPTIRLTSPSANARISGRITLRAVPSPVAPAKVAWVQFLLDGQPLGRRVAGPRYTYAWTIGRTRLGRHLLSARVTDSKGDVGTARSVPVLVGPAKLDVRWLRWRRGTFTVVVGKLPKRAALWVKLEFARGRPRVMITKGRRLRVRTQRPARVLLRVVVGRRQLGTAITARLGEAPTVRITNPIAGETLSSTVPLVADATDDVAVSSVQFAVDGKHIGTPVTAPPYAVHWRTTTVGPGRHVISALATDPTGHTAKTTAVVNVRNPPPPMTCFVQQADLSARGHGDASTASFHTAAAGETLLAFVSADGPAGAHQRATVSGAGLSWRLVRRANSSPGDSEIWTATAHRILTAARVTSVLDRPNFDESLTVVAMEGAAGVGSAVAGSGRTGAPRVGLRTKADTSLVFAVGNERDHAVARILPTGSVSLDQWLDNSTGDTFWSQYTNQATERAGTAITVRALQPVTDRWNLAAVELEGDDS